MGVVVALCGRAVAVRGGAPTGLRLGSGLGGGLDGDVVSEASEFGDESVCALFGVVAGVEVVLAEFVVLDVVLRGCARRSRAWCRRRRIRLSCRHVSRTDGGTDGIVLRGTA